jgi:hypothetical protein
MNISVIKKLVETQSVEELLKAERALIEDEPLPFEIEGNDGSQQLSYTIAALWIKELMTEKKLSFQQALDTYFRQVRETIN